MEYLIENEKYIRLITFISIFLIIAFWEIIFPQLKNEPNKLIRWINNILLVVLNTFVIRLCLPVLPLGVAKFTANKGIGLFNILDLNPILGGVLAILILDLIIYWQHVFFHKISFLWRLHMVHHADTGYDVTLGSRFHPIEILISVFLKIFFIIVLGVPVWAIIVFELILNGAAMFNHGNIYLPPKVDVLLRKLIVTPNFHRVHHSKIISETNSNYGFNIPWWDYMFGTYKNRDNMDEIDLGLNELRDKSNLYLHRLLIIPFLKRR